MPRNPLALSVIVLAVAALACGTPSRNDLGPHPSPTVEPTQTPIIVEVEKTVVVIQTTTPIIIKTTTPTPTNPAKPLCISATEAVYLRPSASENGYPILPLKNGTKVRDLGGRDGNWMFVEIENKRGWVNKKFVSDC